MPYSNLKDSIDGRYQAKFNKKANWIAVIIVAIAVVVMFAWYLSKNNEMVAMNYSHNVHVCVSSVREFNQYNAAIQLDPTKCLSNPLAIK